MKNKAFSIILFFVLLLGICGCKKPNDSVKESAQAVATAFTDSDMATIYKSIFRSNEITFDHELSDIWGEEVQSQDGVLSYIFDLVTVEIGKITDRTIEYEITAPDMRNVFTSIDINDATISEDQLLQYVKNYAQVAESRKTTVSLEYTLLDDELIINYQNEAFLNAVTGGLLEAYRTLYFEMIETFMEG